MFVAEYFSQYRELEVTVSAECKGPFAWLVLA